MVKGQQNDNVEITALVAWGACCSDPKKPSNHFFMNDKYPFAFRVSTWKADAANLKTGCST